MGRLVTLVLLALALVACVGPADVVDPLEPPPPTEPADGVDVEQPPLARPDLIVEDCPRSSPEDAACGFLVVPEDRDDPIGPVIEMAYTRLGAVGRATGSPLVVIPDGPGQSGLAEVDLWADSPLRDGRDIILLDPRGAGRSFPSLDCGEPPRPGALPLDLVEDCRSQLQGQGITVDAYDTGAIAADVADLIRTLRLPTADLLGIGHGGKVALSVVRDAPQRIGAVVLDSVIPPEVDVYADRPVNGQSALNRLLDACIEQPRCEAAFGDLRVPFESLVVQLDRQPVEVEPGREVSGTDLVLAAVAAMRGASGAGAVPASLAAAIGGEPGRALAELQAAAIAGSAVPESAFSEGLRLSADCRDEVPSSAAADRVDDESLTPVGRALAADVNALLAACALWAAGESAPSAAEPVTGAVPVLVLVGEFDPLSPPAYGASVAARLDQAVVVQVGGAGHRVHDVDACTTGLVQAFLTDPADDVDGACAASRVVSFDGT
jgi:pimeloyl-ACP methyl ester carboxylesterase